LTSLLKKVKPKHLQWDSYLIPLADHQTNPVFGSSKAMAACRCTGKGRISRLMGPAAATIARSLPASFVCIAIPPGADDTKTAESRH